MTKFRPCIDLHQGQVKQIVGGTLGNSLVTNSVSLESPAYFAELYKKHNLTGGHVIKLGPGNDEAAIEALQGWHNNLQLGGGVGIDNALEWIDKGASKVIVTSWLFPNAQFDVDRLRRLSELIGTERLVVDLSCRSRGSDWIVATDKWQTRTDFKVDQGIAVSLTKENIKLVEEYCSEFLIHAADVEGLCQGIDQDLVKCLGEWSSKAMTYAGGAKSLSDLDLVESLSKGKVDLTFGR